MVDYNPKVILTYADQLYSQATNVLVTYMLCGLVGGCMIGYFISDNPVFVIGGGFVGLLIGYLLGNARAFALRLKAQLVLCLVQIEFNTQVDDGDEA